MNNEPILKEIFRIYPNAPDFEKPFLEIYVNEDGMISIETTCPVSEEYFGKVRLELEPRIVKKLIEALKVLSQ